MTKDIKKIETKLSEAKTELKQLKRKLKKGKLSPTEAKEIKKTRLVLKDRVVILEREFLKIKSLTKFATVIKDDNNGNFELSHADKI